MIGKKKCLRCKDVHLIQGDYRDGYGGLVSLTYGALINVSLELCLCPKCGYVEWGLKSTEDLKQVRKGLYLDV
jgi:hypothetical protein